MLGCSGYLGCNTGIYLIPPRHPLILLVKSIEQSIRSEQKCSKILTSRIFQLGKLHLRDSDRPMKSSPDPSRRVRRLFALNETERLHKGDAKFQPSCWRLPGVNVTGIDVNSFEKFDVNRVIGPAICMSGIRCISSSNSTRNSSRASPLPRQKCAPPPPNA
jgi:hypothetical protein